MRQHGLPARRARCMRRACHRAPLSCCRHLGIASHTCRRRLAPCVPPRRCLCLRACVPVRSRCHHRRPLPALRQPPLVGLCWCSSVGNFMSPPPPRRCCCCCCCCCMRVLIVTIMLTRRRSCWWRPWPLVSGTTAAAASAVTRCRLRLGGHCLDGRRPCGGDGACAVCAYSGIGATSSGTSTPSSTGGWPACCGGALRGRQHGGVVLALQRRGVRARRRDALALVVVHHAAAVHGGGVGLG